MTELGRAYGSALYALAEDEKQEDAFLSQLGEVCKLLADNPDYVRLIKDKAIAKPNVWHCWTAPFPGRFIRIC